jgi:hypothetical protein
MQDETLNQFNKLVEQRSARGKVVGGEIFALWGVLNLIAFFTDYYLWSSIFVWLIMILAGAVIQVVYFRFKVNKPGFRLFWVGIVNQLWLFMVILIPFIFYVFPFLLRIYSPEAIFPLIFLWLSAGLLVTGLIVEQPGFIFGGIATFAAAILLVVFMNSLLIIYPAAIVAGLIIPGIWSRYEEKK